MARCSRELGSGGEFRSGKEGEEEEREFNCGSVGRAVTTILFSRTVSASIYHWLPPPSSFLPFPVSPQFTFLRKRKIGGLKIPLLSFDFPGLQGRCCKLPRRTFAWVTLEKCVLLLTGHAMGGKYKNSMGVKKNPSLPLFMAQKKGSTGTHNV